VSIARGTAGARALGGRIAGRVVVPGDTGWDLARQPWNLAVRPRPSAVAFPESAGDAQTIVAFARRHKLRIAPQGTGHGALSRGSLEDTILLNTARMRGVHIDPLARRARVQAGTSWGEVAAAAARHGLAGLAGSSPTVGVVGYSINGGLGWLARQYGLAANRILAADVVTAGGRLVRADREHHPDLFWAIRGGGGSFGIITALEFALYPVRQLYGGALFWPPERAREVLRAWHAWTDFLPEKVTSIARLRRMPSRPEIPQQLRGRSFAIVEAACMGAEADAIRLLRPLRALDPEIDTFVMRPMTELGPLHLDPHQPMPRIGDGRLLADLPAAAIDGLRATAIPRPGSAVASVEVRHLEGALARRSAAHGALASLDARFAVYAVGMAATPELVPPVEHAIDLLLDMLAPWDAGRRYPNFAERRADASEFYPAQTLGRLRQIKAAYDPDELIRSNHPIPPAPATHRPGGACAGA
jgi:FAD/FMN-containing dehydrogenase